MRKFAFRGFSIFLALIFTLLSFVGCVNNSIYEVVDDTDESATEKITQLDSGVLIESEYEIPENTNSDIYEDTENVDTSLATENSAATSAPANTEADSNTTPPTGTEQSTEADAPSDTETSVSIDTDAPATDAPATDAPATDAPATDAPVTDAPATDAPATDAPATDAPATDAPATEAPKPTYVNINWKNLYDSGYMRSQWWNDIDQTQNNYTSIFTVTATANSLNSTPKSSGDNRSYFSTKMYNITASTHYEYTFEAKNNRAKGYAGVIFAYDVNGKLPYFAYGAFDNNSDKGSCAHIRYRKGHFNAEDYNCEVNTNDVTATVKQTSDGYGQYKVIYNGFNVKFCYLNANGQYVQLGSTITLPQGSKVCLGVYSREGASADKRTVALKNCVLTAKNDATVDLLSGQNISLIKKFSIKVGSYNIFHAEKAGYDYAKIASVIKDSGLDIIGLQEVDHYTKRNGWTNQTSEIAAKLGYKHRVFFKAIDHDQGEYGLAIISKYPIQSHEIIKLSSGSGEQRILAHAKILVNNTTIDFFVTHLSYDGESGNRATQFSQVATQLAKYKNFILTGDFNTRNLNEYSVIKNAALVNSKTNTVVTYPDGNSPLDNIVYSTAKFSSSGPNVVKSSYSDHYMIWSTITYTDK